MFPCLHCLPDNHSNMWEKDGEENTDDDGGRVDSHHVPQSWDSWNELKKVFFVKWFIWKSHRARLFCRSDKAQTPWKLMKTGEKLSSKVKMLPKNRPTKKKGKPPKTRHTWGCTWWGGRRWAFGRRGRSWRRPWARRACGSCSAGSDHDHGEEEEEECGVEDHDNDDDGNGNDDPLHTLKFVVLCESTFLIWNSWWWCWWWFYWHPRCTTSAEGKRCRRILR